MCQRLSRPLDHRVVAGGCGEGLRRRDRGPAEGIGLGGRVLLLVQAHKLRLPVDAQEVKLLEHQEAQARERAGPRDDGQDHDDLDSHGLAPRSAHATVGTLGAAPAAPAMEVVEALAPVEERRGDEAPGPASAVHAAGVHGVVDLAAHEQHGGGLVDEGADEADGDRAATLNVAAAGGDGDEAGEDAIAEGADIVLVRQEVAQDEHHDAASGGGERRVHGHLSGQRPRLLAVHAQGGARVETVPPKPEREGAQDDQGHVVRLELLGLLEAALARPQHVGARERANAAGEVDDAAAREVHVAHAEERGQPAVAPGPGHDHGVDEGGHEEGEGRVGRALQPLRHAAAHDGGARGAEGPLEEPREHGARRRAVAQRLDLAVPARREADPEELAGADEAVGQLAVLGARPAIGEGPAKGPPAEGPEADVHEVLHEHVRRVLGPAAPRLQHGEAGVHEHHQGPAEDQPRGVHGTLNARVLLLQRSDLLRQARPRRARLREAPGLHGRELCALGLDHLVLRGELLAQRRELFTELRRVTITTGCGSGDSLREESQGDH
mmetsp:Transcript_4715/g.10677  ORF Transcript_4715/g.10677 Transcript_4715/m.10677 type:complete len:552 (+) Transcript_4715:478-2133(+)